jgi:hypothetical protein
MGTFGSEGIWDQASGGNHWADPHRPGHLLHLKGGLLFRATGADLAPHAVLKDADSWTAVDPFWGKTGNTVTMAFRSRVLEDAPVYYLGTSTGQVWRGSPEVGWTKLCECGNGNAINGIAPDLFRNERIFVATAKSTSPGRIKQVTRLANGAWKVTDIDGNFTPQLSVSQITSLAVDSAMRDSQGTAVYVGTDQGMYRGFLGRPVADPFAVSLMIPPIGIEQWTWRRSPGIPNVWVTEVQVHQNFQGGDHSGVIRASTYGRGLYELNRVLSPTPPDPRPIVLTVGAIQVGEDGAPPMLAAEITVLLEGKRYKHDAPFEIAPSEGAEVLLEAPAEIKEEHSELAFVGWQLPDGKNSSERRIALRMSEAVNVVAHYEEARSIPSKDAKALELASTASARLVCVQNLTHELLLSWEITEGQRPVEVRAEITFPDRHRDIIEFKPIQGTQSIPMNYPAGGTVGVKFIATDSTDKPAVTESAVPLVACDK